jgi:hypothetical protein
MSLQMHFEPLASRRHPPSGGNSQLHIVFHGLAIGQDEAADSRVVRGPSHDQVDRAASPLHGADSLGRKPKLTARKYEGIVGHRTAVADSARAIGANGRTATSPMQSIRPCEIRETAPLHLERTGFSGWREIERVHMLPSAVRSILRNGWRSERFQRCELLFRDRLGSRQRQTERPSSATRGKPICRLQTPPLGSGVRWVTGVARRGHIKA